ncbi:MAG: hypothetical protein LWW83_06350 [Azonexaceae bacterium]|nr:hypothetical protein [Azonexaceae bacterium]
MEKINLIQNRITETETTISNHEAETHKARERLEEVSRIIRNTDEVLARPYSYPHTDKAQRDRAEAFARRSELNGQLNKLQIAINNLSLSLAEDRRELANLQYDDVSTDEIRAEIDQAVKHLVDLYAKRDDLEAERARLTQKRESAQNAVDRVASIRQEITKAKAERQRLLADAFVDGTTVDEDDVNIRIQSLEEELHAASATSEHASAALSLLSERLSDVDDELDSLAAARKEARLNYWLRLERLHYRNYSNQLEALLETLLTLRAISTRTGCTKRRVAGALYDGLSGGLCLPVRGTATKRFQPPHDAGKRIEGITEKLRGALDSAIEAKRGNHHG